LGVAGADALSQDRGADGAGVDGEAFADAGQGLSVLVEVCRESGLFAGQALAAHGDVEAVEVLGDGVAVDAVPACGRTAESRRSCRSA